MTVIPTKLIIVNKSSNLPLTHSIIGSALPLMYIKVLTLPRFPIKLCHLQLLNTIRDKTMEIPVIEYHSHLNEVYNYILIITVV